MREREIISSAERARAELEAAGRPEIRCNTTVRVTREVSLPRCLDHMLLRFPSGYQSTRAKVADTETTRALGATEFELLIPIGRLRDGDLAEVYDDVHAGVVAADGRNVNAILGTTFLLQSKEVRVGVAALHAGISLSPGGTL